MAKALSPSQVCHCPHHRFVRERGHRVVTAVVAVCDEASLRVLAPEVAARLADGLNDSWSHVSRLAIALVSHYCT